MTPRPSIDDLFTTMSAASVGDTTARVPLPDDPAVDDPVTLLAVALNVLLDDLAFREAEAEAAHKAAEAELERLVAERTRELVAVNKELESFSSSVAHDLRSPLGTIDGFTHLLLEDHGAELSEQANEYLSYVRTSVRQMTELIDDLLTLSRVTRSELRRERVDLSASARAIVDGLRRTDPGRHVEVHIQDHLVAEGDRSLLSAALNNLLGNAWKFTRGRTTARIEFGCREEEDGRVYFVRDNGAGFDMAYAHKLFEEFQRLHATVEFEGTGIGLATVRRIVRRHGGHVWAEGEVDRGATIYFTLEEDQSG